MVTNVYFDVTDVCFDGHSVTKAHTTDMHSGQLLPLDSLIMSQKLSTPPILRGRKKSRRSGSTYDNSMNDSSLADHSHNEVKHEPLTTPKCENKTSSAMHTPKQEPKTPQRSSPLKDLPFSPSAFLNSPDTHCAPIPGNLTSTPVGKDPLNATPGNDSGMHTPKIKVEDTE
jgi:hypothetical protein